MRAEVAVAASGDQEDVVSVSETDFDVPLSLHVLLQDKLSLHDCQKNWITYFTTCNISDAQTLFFLDNFTGFAQRAGHEWVSEWKQNDPLSIKFLSIGSKIAASILARYQWSTTTRKSLTSAVMSLSSWSISNSSVLAWNSSSEFKMWLSLDKTFLSLQDTYLPRGSNGFFVAEWIALGLTCPGDLCVFKFVCNWAITPSIPNLELSRRSSFFELLDPFMVADGFCSLP